MDASSSPTRNYGRTFRVNYKCPNCGVHIRVPVLGYGRNGWNCRMFTCLKCKKRYSMHIATTVHEGTKTPGVGTMTKKRLREYRRQFKEDVDHLDLVFFNGHTFRPMLADFLRSLAYTIEGIRKKVPGFQLLFPEIDAVFQNMLEEAKQAMHECKERYDRDQRDAWSQL